MSEDLSPLDRATNLVSTQWFPYSRTNAEALLGTLKESSFSANRDLFWDRLSSDPSLFLLYLKFYSASKDRDENPVTTYEEMYEASPDTISKYLVEAINHPIGHQMKDLTKVQEIRLAETTLSRLVTSKLASKAQVSKNLSISTSLLRQLGLSLIAWNYPRVFEKIWLTKTVDVSIDSEIRKILGFTPLLLAHSVIKSWEINKLFESLVTENPNEANLKKENNDLALYLLTVCRVGESFSRALNPSVYESAQVDAFNSFQFLAKAFGTSIVSRIVTEAKVSLDSCSEGLSQLISDTFESDFTELVSSEKKVRKMFSTNPWVQYLEPTVKDLFRKTYGAIVKQSNPSESLKIFSKEIFPASSFNNFVVYLFDPLEAILYPSLSLGKFSTVKPKVIPLYGAKNPFHDLVVSSLEMTMPVRQSISISDTGAAGKKEISVVVGGFGEKSRVGVLYGELSEGATEDPIKYFKAFQMILKDSLGL